MAGRLRTRRLTATTVVLVAAATSGGACGDAQPSGTTRPTASAVLEVLTPTPSPGDVLASCDRVHPRDGFLRAARYEYDGGQSRMRIVLRGVAVTEPVRASIDILVDTKREITIPVGEPATSGTGPTTVAPVAIDRDSRGLTVTIDRATTQILRTAAVYQFWVDATVGHHGAFCDGPAIDRGYIGTAPPDSIGPTD